MNTCGTCKHFGKWELTACWAMVATLVGIGGYGIMAHPGEGFIQAQWICLAFAITLSCAGLAVLMACTVQAWKLRKHKAK